MDTHGNTLHVPLRFLIPFKSESSGLHPLHKLCRIKTCPAAAIGNSNVHGHILLAGRVCGKIRYKTPHMSDLDLVSLYSASFSSAQHTNSWQSGAVIMPFGILECNKLDAVPRTSN